MLILHMPVWPNAENKLVMLRLAIGLVTMRSLRSMSTVSWRAVQLHLSLKSKPLVSTSSPPVLKARAQRDPCSKR